jgi:hypothetical protein
MWFLLMSLDQLEKRPHCEPHSFDSPCVHEFVFFSKIHFIDSHDESSLCLPDDIFFIAPYNLKIYTCHACQVRTQPRDINLMVRRKKKVSRQDRFDVKAHSSGSLSLLLASFSSSLTFGLVVVTVVISCSFQNRGSSPFLRRRLFLPRYPPPRMRCRRC